MNIVPVQGGDGNVTLADGVKIALPHLPDTLTAVEMGIRPEHIDVVDTKTATLIGIADVVEHLGSDTNIYVNVEGLGPLMVRKHGNIPAKAGDSIGLRIQSENVHIFATDGTALRRYQAEAA
jgi:multiple sugar transport system ATP-binding protein